MSSIVVVFLLFIVADLVLLYRNKRKLMEKERELKDKEFLQTIKQLENNNLQEILNSLEDERNRIAQDLHDKVGASISTVKLYFEGMKELVNKGDKNIEQSFLKVDSILATTLGEVRNVSRNITSGVLADFGLIPAIIDLVETIESSGQIIVFFSHKLTSNRLQKNIEINIYRILQELISNTIKHAQCNKISIYITEKHETLEINYTDDGKGFDATLQTNGMGSKNIKTRVTGLGGTLNNKSSFKNGARYFITIPTESNLFENKYKPNNPKL